MANSNDKMSEQSFVPDPLLGSDSFIFNDPNQPIQPDPIYNSYGDASRAPVGEGSDLKGVPGSDPLLGSDAFIAAETVEVQGDFNQTPVPKNSEAKRGKRTRKGADDAGETPDWLPAGWTITTRTRTNGATKGTVDRYYVEPGTGQRFRSKIEVKRYLETGSKNKHSDPSAMPSEAKGTKTKKSGTKKKKEAAWSFDFENPPEEVTWSLVDKDQGLWNASIGEERVPETTAQEWATTFERACQMD